MDASSPTPPARSADGVRIEQMSIGAPSGGRSEVRFRLTPPPSARWSEECDRRLIRYRAAFECPADLTEGELTINAPTLEVALATRALEALVAAVNEVIGP